MATRLEVPILYHPTNTVLLDDDPKYLNDVSLILDATIPYVLDSEPKKILNYLKSHTYDPKTLAGRILKSAFTDDDMLDSNSFFINFSWMLDELQSPDRFKKAAVGLIDRRMKKIDGLQLCRDIRDNKTLIDLVLFTGQTKLEEAVAAFNDQIIDGYLVKSGDPASLAQEINKVIMEHSWRLFARLTSSLMGMLSDKFEPLYDKQFGQTFNKIKAKYNITEFYLLDSSCSFLLLDSDGVAKQLFVKSQSEFNDCLEMATNAKAPTQIIRDLKDCQQFPYTREPNGYVKFYTDDQWENAMVQMDKVPGRELFYAIVDRPDIEVFSFNHYLEDVWPDA